MYFITNSGKRIDITNFKESDVCLNDIAHALTKICRFGGSLDLNVHYSVAMHSLYLSGYAGKEGYSIDLQRYLLMHDASEAYLGDLISGIKVMLPDYQDLQKHVSNIIYNKYNIMHHSLTELIGSTLDKRIVLDEAVGLMPQYLDAFAQQAAGIERLGVEILPDTSLDVTKELFLSCCKNLEIGD